MRPFLRMCAEDLAATISPKDLYIGDRVKLKGSGRTGEVMYVGPAQFAGGEIVVGIKLDEKRSSSDCDGKQCDGPTCVPWRARLPVDNTYVYVYISVYASVYVHQSHRARVGWRRGAQGCGQR